MFISVKQRKENNAIMTQKKSIYCKLQNKVLENELACSEEYKGKSPQETGTHLFQKFKNRRIK